MEGSSAERPINTRELLEPLLKPCLRNNWKLCKQFKEANNGKTLSILLIYDTEVYRVWSHDLQQVQEHLVLAVQAILNIRKASVRVARAQAWSAHTEQFGKLQCLCNLYRDYNSQNTTCSLSRCTFLLILPDVARYYNSKNSFVWLKNPYVHDLVLNCICDSHDIVDSSQAGPETILKEKNYVSKSFRTTFKNYNFLKI